MANSMNDCSNGNKYQFPFLKDKQKYILIQLSSPLKSRDQTLIDLKRGNKTQRNNKPPRNKSLSWNEANKNYPPKFKVDHFDLDYF